MNNKQCIRTLENTLESPLDCLGWALFKEHAGAFDMGETGNTARVIGVRKNSFVLSNGCEEWLAFPAGRLRQAGEMFPAAGDWVQFREKLVTKVLPRKNALSRGAAGLRHGKDEGALKQQIMATNVDTVFIVSGLDRDFNLRRLERYLTLVYNCGMMPVIVLTKADLQEGAQIFVYEAEHVAPGVPVHLVSARTEAGISVLERYLEPGRTVVLVGSSGAGKSTLVNRLAGAPVQATGEVSGSVGKGRHTTTSRDLILMPQGGMIIDNPGIREIAFWDMAEPGASGAATSAFPEIEELARGCRFADCRHLHEPDCNVLQGLADGIIIPERLESYRKMQREMDYLALRQECHSSGQVEKKRRKDISKQVKALKKRHW